MNCNLSSYFCCLGQNPLVQFEYSRPQYSGNSAYLDIYCSIERSFIREGDYLMLSDKGIHDPKGTRYQISREPGNNAGVARIMFPNQPGVYTLYFVRQEGREIKNLGSMAMQLATPFQSERLFSVSEASPSRESSRYEHSFK